MTSFSKVSHISLSARDMAANAKWNHFHRLDVTHSPIAERDYGSVLAFRDPDDVQLEMFYREDHP